jgi:predicted deacylase
MRCDPADVEGRLIIIPILSMDAAKAFARCWPEGSGSPGTNFNRVRRYRLPKFY